MKKGWGVSGERGQVTIFIILGLIIIISAGAVAYVTIKRNVEDSGVDISKEVEPVVSYVEDCIEGITLDGLNILGAQGGWIYLPEQKVEANPLNSHPNALDIFGDGKTHVAYWFYESGNGIQKEQIPTIAVMETELERYVTENAGNCIANFSFFNGYEIEGFAEARTEAEIKDNRIIVTVESPTRITRGSTSQKVEKFRVSLESGMGEAYKKAKEIYDAETKDTFLEKRTIDMMVLYDEIPLSGSYFDCQEKIWSVENVKKDFRKIASYNMGAVRLKENNLDAEQKYFSIDSSKDDFDFGVLYSESWAFEMEVQPSENGIMKGEDVVRGVGDRFLSSVLCINNYHFVYDISYPVLVTLRNSKGEMFQFAYEVIIKNNQEREDKLSRETTELAPDICDKKAIKATVESLSAGSSGNALSLSGADIYFKCFSAKCHIGKTGSDGSLTALVPQCINGAFIGEKEGYYFGKTSASTNVEVSTSVMLEPIYHLNYSVQVIDEKDGSIRNLKDGESVIIDISPFDAIDGGEGGYATSSSYPSSEGMEIIPGEHQVKAYLLRSGEGTGGRKIVLEEQTVRNCVTVPKKGILGLFLNEEKCIDVNVEGGEVDSVVLGGAEFEWDAVRTDIAGGKRIAFYVMEGEEPKNFEDIGEIYEKIGYYSSNPNFIYPHPVEVRR
jgi:hypothetical protein